MFSALFFNVVCRYADIFSISSDKSSPNLGIVPTVNNV